MKYSAQFSFLTNILLSIAVITSILVLCGGLITQFYSRREFQKSLEEAVASIGKEDKDLRESLISDIERLVELQKVSSSTDTTAFFYTFFCSIFIAIGAAYVKSVQNKANDVQSKASDVQKKADAIGEIIDVVSQNKIDLEKVSSEIVIASQIKSNLEKVSSELWATQNILAVKEWLSLCAAVMEKGNKSAVLETLDEYMPRINDGLLHYKKFLEQRKIPKENMLLLFLSKEAIKSFDHCQKLDSKEKFNSFSPQYVSYQKKILEKCSNYFSE